MPSSNECNFLGSPNPYRCICGREKGLEDELCGYCQGKKAAEESFEKHQGDWDAIRREITERLHKKMDRLKARNAELLTALENIFALQDHLINGSDAAPLFGQSVKIARAAIGQEKEKK